MNIYLELLCVSFSNTFAALQCSLGFIEKTSLNKISFCIIRINMSPRPGVPRLQPLCTTALGNATSHSNGIAGAFFYSIFLSSWIISVGSAGSMLPSAIFCSGIRNPPKSRQIWSLWIDPSWITPLRVACHLQNRFEIGLFAAAGNLHFITQIISLKAAKKDCGL